MRGGEKVNICLLIFLAVVSQINLESSKLI